MFSNSSVQTAVSVESRAPFWNRFCTVGASRLASREPKHIREAEEAGVERSKMIGIDRRTADTIAFDKATRTGSFLFHAHDRHSCQVTVTRRGILTAALPPRDGALRFLECMDVFAAIASEKPFATRSNSSPEDHGRRREVMAAAWWQDGNEQTR